MQQIRLFPLYTILFILNTLSAIVYNLFNETLALIPMRVGVAVINGAGFTLILTSILYIIRKFLRINLSIPVLLILLLVFFIESFLLLNFYSIITPSVILVMLETNPDETTEFFHTYLNLKTWLLLGFLTLSSCFCFIYRKYIYRMKLPSFLLQRNRIHILSLAILLSYIGLVYYVTQIRHMTSYQMLTGVERIWHSVRNVWNDRTEQLKYMELVKKEPPIVSFQNDSIQKIPYVVVILNESISKWHMNAYGYSRMTTPLLNKRIKDKETTLFQQVNTPRTITSEAIREIMTFHEESDSKEWYQCHTLPAIMKAAGYYTCWISNQDSFTRGADNSTHSIAMTSDTVIFTHHRHSSEERYGYFDGELLPVLDRVLNKKGEKSYFFCFHLMGAHQRYTNRYPLDYKCFNASYEKRDLSYSQKETVAEYDNCILYSDYICDEILRRFEDKEAIVICFPDHGEEVYDTRNMSGHTAFNPSEAMIQIPFWVWTSHSFKSKCPNVEQRIRQSSEKGFNTTNVIHSIMDLCGLRSQEYNEDKSLFFLSYADYCCK